jgi:hypothetical protein
MSRLLAIPVALAALAVTAAPASAGLPLGVSANAVANHTDGTASVTLGKTLTGKAKIIDGRKEIAPGLVVR